MKRLSFAILMFIVPAVAWAGTIVQPPDCQPVASSYIVVLDRALLEEQGAKWGGTLSTQVDATAKELASLWGGQVSATWSAAIQGFALSSKQRSSAEGMADDARVSYVEQDCLAFASADQVNPPSWGLDRIDQPFLPLDQLFHYTAAGAGAHLYIIDTGVRTTHNDFAGRIGNGFTSQGGTVEDCNGHGTHVAGTSGGTTYGVAKQATIHPVRVLGCTGSGSYAQVISGVDWVTANHQSPAVANMSLGGPTSQALDDAIRGSVAAGVTYAVAAGNESTSACTKSPARVAEALTVGATDISDQIASFSNYGNCVNIFAPGVGITSAWYTNDGATNTINGTSMAAPHVAGVAAVYAAAVGGTPAQIGQAILAAATTGQITGLPAGSPNLLLYSDFLSSDDPPVAAFSFSCSVLTCSFDATGSSDDQGIADYAWSFGDGASGSGAIVSHTYASGGTRTVTLTVTDTSGQTDSVSRQVSVCNDSVAPSVTITAPADGAYVWGSLTIRANASDASGVDRVEFRVGGSLRCTDTAAPYKCTVNVDGFNSGLKTLKARAYDVCGNTRQDTVQAFFVSNPLAALDAPTEGATVEGDAVRLAGWASDPDGIADVRFELDGAPLTLTGPVTYGLSRPDVCSAVPLADPSCPNVGFEAFFDSRLIPDGGHTLQVVAVDNQGKTTRTPNPARQIVVEQPPVIEPCVPGPTTLCLLQSRFKVEATFVQNGTSSAAQKLAGSDQSGYFWFFGADNLEIGIKVLDGTPVNGKFWVYHGGLTSLEYSLRVTDTDTGEVQTYVKPAGSFCGDADTQAFPIGSAAAGSSAKLVDVGSAAAGTGLLVLPTEGPHGPNSLAAAGSTCIADGNTLCLLGGRFQVRVTRGGNPQPALPLTDKSGAFWFFNAANTEVVVKVLDGTPINGSHWVFLGSMSDQDYSVTVTDTVTGAVWSHVNPLGTYCGTADIAAF